MRHSRIFVLLLVVGALSYLPGPSPPPVHPRDPSYIERPTYRLETLDGRWLEPAEGFASSTVVPGRAVRLPDPGVYLDQRLRLPTRGSAGAIPMELDLPKDLELYLSEGGVVLVRERESLEEHHMLRVPLGVDRDGHRIDFRYQVDGRRLVVEPRHRWQIEKAHYPIEIHVGIVPIDWSEALVKAGENCPRCTRDGDVVSVQPAGWPWGREERGRFAIVRLPKLDARERAEMRARSLLVADPATPEEFRRLADEPGLFRYGIDYTELANEDELEAIRDPEEEGPILDARWNPSVLRLKQSPSTSIIPDVRRLAYRAPEPSPFDRLLPEVSAATIVTKTIGTAGRDYSTITAWETGQEGDLITRNTIEKGEMYNDGPFNENILIDLSTTDANHFLWLTVAPTDRHDGTAHDGTNFTGAHLTATTGKVLEVTDNYTIVEWIIFHEWGSGSTEKLALDMSRQDSIARYNVFWGGNSPDPTASAIAADRDRVTVYNNVIYNLPGGSNGGEGIQTQPLGGLFKAYNNTVYNCLVGFLSATTDFVAVNNISVGNGTDYSGTFDAASNRNTDQDGTAPGGLPLTDTPAMFASTTFPEDLHLRAGVSAIDSGLDLTSVMSPTDIDFAPRDANWDRGADEWGATTAVTLVAFEATTAEDGRVLVTWRTGAELDNLGFHLYRAPSADGPFERVTETLVPGLGSSPVGAAYQYLDDGGGLETVYYQLEDVDTRGQTELHGPVLALPRADEGGLAPAPEATRITFGDPESSTLTVTPAPDDKGVVLELTTEGIEATPQPDGTVRLRVPGFDSGDTLLPVKRIWVDAISGRKVKIVSVRAEEVERIGAWEPSTVGAELVAGTNGTVRLAGRTHRKGRRELRKWRKARARLIDVMFQGEAKKALVELSPLMWSPRSGDVFVARKLVVRLVFSGRDRSEGYRGRKRRLGRNVAVRVVTRAAGLYEVRHEDIFRGRRSIPTRRLQLTRLGEPVPYHVEPNPRRFGPGSRLFFVSQGARSNPYGDEAVYELGFGAGGLQMGVSHQTPVGTPVPYGWQQILREEDFLYQPALVNAPDLWLWEAVFAPGTKSFPFEVPALADVPSRATLRLWVQGASDLPVAPDHHVRVSVNDQIVAELSWNGKVARLIEGEIPPGVLREGTNTLAIENVGDTGAAYSMVLVDKFSVRYPRRLGEGDEAGEAFELEVDQWGPIAIEAFDQAHIVDVTGAPEWLGTTTSFQGETGHRYLITPVEHVLRPTFRSSAGPRLKRRIRADYLVIGPRELLPAARPLLRRRRQQGLRVKAVAVEDIYAELGFGETRPEAIRDFVSDVYHEGAARKLRYLLLLGDGSYDFKDRLGTGAPNHVPPYIVQTRYLWTASDPAYAAVNGDDDLPDLAVGRLPATDASELQTMVQKILLYESEGRGLSAPMVLVSDNGDDAGDFRAAVEELAGRFAARRPRTIHLEELGVAATRQAISDAFAAGASSISYVGHGGIHLWADEDLFDTADVASLAPQSRMPIVLTMNCLNGYFHFPYFDSLSEGLLQAEGKGAIAVVAPSGLSLHEPAHRFHQALLEEIDSGRHRRLGDAVFAAQKRYAATGAFPELLRIYHLFGDPALVIRGEDR